MPCASAWRRRASIDGPAIERISDRGSLEDRSVGMWSIASYNRDVSKGDLLPAARGLDSQQEQFPATAQLCEVLEDGYV